MTPNKILINRLYKYHEYYHKWQGMGEMAGWDKKKCTLIKF